MTAHPSPALLLHPNSCTAEHSTHEQQQLVVLLHSAHPSIPSLELEGLKGGVLTKDHVAVKH